MTPEKLSAAAGLLELLLDPLDLELEAAGMDDEPVAEAELRVRNREDAFLCVVASKLCDGTPAVI